MFTPSFSLHVVLLDILFHLMSRPTEETVFRDWAGVARASNMVLLIGWVLRPNFATCGAADIHVHHAGLY